MITHADIKVGAKLGVCSGGWETRCELRTVTRKTATQLVLDDGSRWTKSGRKIGESYSYHGSYLVMEKDALELIAEYRAKMERAALMREINDAAYSKMTTAALKEIAESVRKYSALPPQHDEEKK